MTKIYLQIKETLVGSLEDYFCENDLCNWGVSKDNDADIPELFGFFDSKDEAITAFADLRESFPELSTEYSIEEIEDSDWKDKYKKFLTAYNYENLHWVPLWMKGEYSAPQDHKVLYFDAGLAFGTGDHPTTRLCAIAMMRRMKEVGDVSGMSVIDAGCGSGILALSAKLFGFGDVYGFDRDPEAIRASVENARENDIEGVPFDNLGIESALENRKADIVLANIQADVLCIYAENLANAVKPNGRLILSGILKSENAEVKEFFDKVCAENFYPAVPEFMDEWSSLELVRKS